MCLCLAKFGKQTEHGFVWETERDKQFGHIGTLEVDDLLEKDSKEKDSKQKEHSVCFPQTET